MNIPNVGKVEEEDLAAPVVAREWPTLSDAAMQGAAGEIVEMADRYTEADSAAVLATLLARFGVIVGPGPHFKVSNIRHPALTWPLIVGGTSQGAKGTSYDVATALTAETNALYPVQWMTGLSSGEGLIEAVRDPSGDPEEKDYDPGVDDKRLIVRETEFSSVLNRMARQGSSLGGTLRDVWDGAPLGAINRKNSRLRADTHHIGVIAHISPYELVDKLNDSDLAGGSINRYLMILSKRSKLRPKGGNLPPEVLDKARAILAGAKANAGLADIEFQRSSAAETLWDEIYPHLMADRGDGRVGQATTRAVPQVLRLSLAYAVIDSSPGIVEESHLRAALALWDYAEASARYVFGTATAKAEAEDREKLLQFITEGGEAGVAKSQIYIDLYNRDLKSAQIDARLRPLIESGQVGQSRTAGAGRPATIFTAVKKVKKVNKPSDLGKHLIDPEINKSSKRSKRSDAGPLMTLNDVSEIKKSGGKTPGQTLNDLNDLFDPAESRPVSGSDMPTCPGCHQPITQDFIDLHGTDRHPWCRKQETEYAS